MHDNDIVVTKQLLRTRELYEVANSSSYDANGTMLGTWNPHHMIEGPHGSIFVACNTAVKSSYGANSVYCYHVVVSQNVATEEFYTSNIYPVYANSNWQNSDWQYCNGLALDHNDPPNLYFATGNTVYKIEPKGYSYHMGDTKITQLFGEHYLRLSQNYSAKLPSIGKYYILDPSPMNLYKAPTSYIPLKVDRQNRVFFAARSNIFCYDTRTNTIETVYEPRQHSANIAYSSLLNANLDLASIASFDLDLDTNEVYFSLRSTAGGGRVLLGKIRPNSNNSYNVSAGGITSELLMRPAVTTQAQFTYDGTQGTNLYRSLTGSQVILRPSKN